MQRVLRSLQSDAGSAAEFYADIPSRLRSISSLHQRPGNDLAWFLVAKIAVGTGSAGPVVALRQANLMRAHWGRTVRTFFDVEMVEPRLGIDLPIKGETVLHRNPKFL